MKLNISGRWRQIESWINKWQLKTTAWIRQNREGIARFIKYIFECVLAYLTMMSLWHILGPFRGIISIFVFLFILVDAIILRFDIEHLLDRKPNH